MNTEVCLGWWTWRRVRVHLSVDTGIFRFSLWPCSHPKRGWAWQHRNIWYALRLSSHAQIVLQVARKCWELKDTTYAGVSRINDELKFRIQTSNETFEVEYDSPSDRLWNRYDVTFDGLDEEINDFFVMVSRVWEDPMLRQSIAKAWSMSNSKAD